MLFQQLSLTISTALFGAMPVIAAPVPFKMSSQQSQMVSPDLIRAAQASEPVAIKDIKSHDLTCGRGASVQHQDHPVEIDAGTKLQIQWSEDWKHSVGPIITYLAACRENDCAESDVTTLDWFKIDQKAADTDGNWWQASLGDDRMYVPIPSSLKEGKYIVRHEVIVIDQDPVLFFPACAALDIRNNNVDTEEQVYPASNYTVQIPGAYSESDKGLQTVDESFDPYSYVFPGPDVWQPQGALVESASSDGFYQAAEMDVDFEGDAYQVQFLAPNVTTSSVNFVSSTATTIMPSPTMTIEEVSSLSTSATATSTSSPTASPTANFYHAQLAPMEDINHGDMNHQDDDDDENDEESSSSSFDDGSWNAQKYDGGNL